jgi:hypothetical protein
VVGHWKGTISRSGLQKAQEDRCSWAKGMAEGHALTAPLIPLELGLLHEERLSTVPARYLDGIRIGSPK